MSPIGYRTLSLRLVAWCFNHLRQPCTSKNFQYPLNRRQYGSQCWTGRFGKEKYLFVWREVELRILFHPTHLIHHSLRLHSVKLSWAKKSRQVAERRGTRTEMVLETLVYSSFNHLQLLARESSIENLSQPPFKVRSWLDGRTDSASTKECFI